ncbi:hypothetical protein [Pseudomonas chlororaphis]|uniref:hypothetical protein n=1 Tax=Pseudomonas chlororaphis TaxID=587753 RepID=UPI0012DA93A7|nr:hypothetical protein [Pseudomonas chlororaphis]
MSQTKVVEVEVAGRLISDEELAVHLEYCLQRHDPELLNNIARSVVLSRFPQIASEPAQEKNPSLLTHLQVWQRLVSSLAADFKNRGDNCMDALRQWRHARRH